MSLKLLTSDRAESIASQGDTIREVCASHMEEPTRLWEALEARGIDATPGVISLAIADLCKHQGKTVWRRG